MGQAVLVTKAFPKGKIKNGDTQLLHIQLY